jgi:multiple sugar transport system ATP-binding protein
MRTEISRMQRRLGTTTIYVTHDQTEAMTLGDRVTVLKRGVLQQCASPRELYEQPVNLFVAGFIGSPPMNFLPGHVEGRTLHLPFVDVPLADDVARRASGRDLLLAGVRPEHFEDASVLDSSKIDKGVTFDVDVDVTEWLGDELYAYIPFEPDPAVQAKLEELDRDTDGEGMRTQLIVSLDAMSRVRDGDRARLWFDPRRMHLFDPETGENLTRNEDEARRIQEENERLRQESLARAQRADRSERAGGTTA